jgi:hypothetical protein
MRCKYDEKNLLLTAMQNLPLTARVGTLSRMPFDQHGPSRDASYKEDRVNTGLH